VILDALRSASPGVRPGPVLDVGCGDGLFFDRLAEFGDVEGVEPDVSIVDPRGPHADRIHLVPFDARFRADKRFSLILMLDVLEHLADPVDALRHAVDLLADDGLLLITVPAFPVLWTAHDDWNHHYVRYTRRTFAEIARRSGLAIDRSRYFFHWTFPVKLAVRLKERLMRRPPQPEEVPPALVNRGLYALSRLEQWTLGKLPIPLGSSLLAVCRKTEASTGAGRASTRLIRAMPERAMSVAEGP
jgi:SAM-dependent methyltransferase